MTVSTNATMPTTRQLCILLIPIAVVLLAATAVGALYRISAELLIK